MEFLKINLFDMKIASDLFLVQFASNGLFERTSLDLVDKIDNEFSPFLLSDFSISLDCLYKKWMIYYWWRRERKNEFTMLRNFPAEHISPNLWMFHSFLCFESALWNIKRVIGAFLLYRWEPPVGVKINKSYTHVPPLLAGVWGRSGWYRFNEIITQEAAAASLQTIVVHLVFGEPAECCAKVN